VKRASDESEERFSPRPINKRQKNGMRENGEIIIIIIIIIKSV